MSTPRDVSVLRQLASEYAELTAKPIQDERRNLWRRHNSLQPTRPLVYVRWGACSNEVVEPHLVCEDPFYRHYENTLRQFLFQDAISDDFILEPWITVQAAHVLPSDGLWGVPIRRSAKTEDHGSWMFDPPLKNFKDIEKLVVPRHEIDEARTQRAVSKLHDAIGDLIEINVDRRPAWFFWTADISTELASLRGLEQMMWDMAMNGEWLHRLVRWMSDGILKAHAEAEAAGDWHRCDHANQAMPYASELADPVANGQSVTRAQLWTYCASQETTEVSPAMFDEFILQYQKPIIEKFGLCAYGCCEDLTRKIDLLRRIPNLRRIAVAPRANLASCVEQIGQDYVISWRPNPATHACCGFDTNYIRQSVREALTLAEGCHIDITLKDVQTVQSEPQRLIEWARTVKEAIQEAR
jgi:hypothetical protein